MSTKSFFSVESNFDNIQDLYYYIQSLDSICENLPKYLNELMKKYNAYKITDYKKIFNENDVELLLHLKIYLQDIPTNESKKLINLIDKISDNFDFNIVQEDLKVLERTDKNLIPESAVKCYPEAVRVMEEILGTEKTANKHIDIIFNNPKCAMVNKKLKISKYYGLDKLNIVIRRESQNKKNEIFGWKYYEDTNIPVSSFYNSILPDNDNIYKILSIQYQMQPTAFTKPTGIIYKIYKNDPVLLKRYEKFIKMKELNKVEKK